uniref:Rho GDP dissociation inhibitor (GDI) gamma n=1 Tax=Nothobranchius furzeri TaxID=105023 RepID=A0A8C6KGE8_NOTFU
SLKREPLKEIKTKFHLLMEEDNERKLNYNPPAQKSLQEIQEMDKDDESLVKYKQTLLGPEAKNTVSALGQTMVCMMGSYGPRAEEQEFLCPADETPKGLMSRGQYQIKSCFVDDDKNAYLSWGWNINISKEWN